MTMTTLGTMREAQTLDGISLRIPSAICTDYNMPPYSTGEAKMMRGPGRREIGHGALAERALLPVIPSEEEFPTPSASFPR